MKSIGIILVLLSLCGLHAFSRAQYTKTFVDPARNNRQIQTVIYYPESVAEPEEPMPYIIFGHGWIMNHSLYSTLTTNLLSLGCIVAFPRTEESLFPDHYEFALDLSFLEGALMGENADPLSPLYGKMMPLSLVMGHSMGGGAAVLAAAMDNGFASLVTFAAAETNVSAIGAAQNVILPSITFAGSADTVTPPAQNQLPIYNNLASDYKSYVSINGAGHLNLYNNALIPQILAPWLEYLKSGEMAWINAFEGVLEDNSASLSYQIVNNLSVSNEDAVNAPFLVSLTSFPNPFSNHVTIAFSLPKTMSAELSIHNIKGQKVRSLLAETLSGGDHRLMWDGKNNRGELLAPGIYLYRLRTGEGVSQGKMLLSY
ncbi:MAG: FlgD immunoglobulin-like domain containing protein [Candidatus Cloacimonadaceae bacterium]|nr:FlgD immunoglobulin-like domain containing protein [Candidatus Cloacimonadaceae bacterium]